MTQLFDTRINFSLSFSRKLIGTSFDTRSERRDCEKNAVALVERHEKVIGPVSYHIILDYISVKYSKERGRPDRLSMQRMLRIFFLSLPMLVAGPLLLLPSRWLLLDDVHTYSRMIPDLEELQIFQAFNIFLSVESKRSKIYLESSSARQASQQVFFADSFNLSELATFRRKEKGELSVKEVSFLVFITLDTLLAFCVNTSFNN